MDSIKKLLVIVGLLMLSTSLLQASSSGSSGCSGSSGSSGSSGAKGCVSVPETSSIVLFGAGILGLVILRRRQQRKA